VQQRSYSELAAALMYPNQLNDLFCKSPFRTLAHKIGIILTYSITLFRIFGIMPRHVRHTGDKFPGLLPAWPDVSRR